MRATFLLVLVVVVLMGVGPNVEAQGVNERCQYVRPSDIPGLFSLIIDEKCPFYNYCDGDLCCSSPSFGRFAGIGLQGGPGGNPYCKEVQPGRTKDMCGFCGLVG